MGRPLGSRNKPKDFDGNNGGPKLRINPDGADLRAYIERVEEVSGVIAGFTSDRRELYDEIKRAGYDVATVRAIIKRRAMDPEKRNNTDELLDLYMSALGDFASTPLGTAGADRIRDEVRV